MTRAKSLALAFYLGAAVAGAVIGVSVDRMWFRAPVNAGPGYYRTLLFNKLSLTPAQRDSAAMIYDDRDRRLKALMDETKPYRAQQDSIFAEGRRRITQMLTADQKAIYEQMQREQRERAQRTEKK